MKAVGVIVAVMLAGCLDPTPVVPVTAVCEAICACQTPLEHAQEVCTSSCEEQLAGLFIPDTCVTCAEESACTELDACFASCSAVPMPVPEEP